MSGTLPPPPPGFRYVEDASGAVPPPPPGFRYIEPPAQPSALGTLARGVVRGATLGFNDEMKGAVAGVGALFTDETVGDAYTRARDAARNVDRRDQAANPGSNLAGQVFGGVGGAVLAAPVAGATGIAALGARAAAPIAARLNPLLGWVPSAVGTGSRMAGAGAAGGAAAGFGEGEGGLGPRLENAVQGGALGAGAGLVVGGGVRAGAGLAGRVGNALGIRNADVAAERQVLRSLDRAGVSVDEAGTRLDAAPGVPLALVDVGGRNTVQLGATAANTPGMAMDAADTFVQGRRLGRPDRLTAAGDQAFGGGSGGDIAAITAQREAQRRAQAGPLYDEVRAFGAVDDPGIADALTRLPDNVFNRASTFARLGGREPSRLMVDGQLTRTPTTEDLDHIGRALGDSIEAAKRSGDNALARELTLARQDLLGQMDDIIVDPNTGRRIYQEARAAYAGPSAQMDATEAGRTALRTDRDVVQRTMDTSPPDVQDAYRLGAGRDFADRVSDPGRASGAARLMLEDGQMQARFNALLGPATRNDLNAVLRRENEMTAVERAVSPRAGSQTGRLAAGGEDMGNDPIGPWGTALMQLTSGQWGQAAGTAARDAWRRIGQGINPATSDALANRLFVTDEAQRRAVIEALRQRQLNDLMRTDRARQVARPMLQGLGVGSGLAAE